MYFLFQAAPLWKLLFELLYFLEHGVIDEVVIKAYNELTLGNVYLNRFSLWFDLSLYQINLSSTDFEIKAIENIVGKGKKFLLTSISPFSTVFSFLKGSCSIILEM